MTAYDNIWHHNSKFENLKRTRNRYFIIIKHMTKKYDSTPYQLRVYDTVWQHN